jgi:hypothetical protein
MHFEPVAQRLVGMTVRKEKFSHRLDSLIRQAHVVRYVMRIDALSSVVQVLQNAVLLHEMELLASVTQPHQLLLDAL